MYGYGFRNLSRSILAGGGGANPNFIMTIDTTKAGSASDTFILPCGNIGTYDATIDWGDGSTSNITTYNDADLTHVYSVGGIYQISITGDLPHIKFLSAVDKEKVISIDNWGINHWLSMENAFYGCTNMVLLATDIPNVSSVVFFNGIFGICSSLTSVSFVGWDTSSAQNMALMFILCTSCNSIDLTGIDTSNVTTFDQTFNKCPNDAVIGLDTLNIEKVTNFANMFFGSSVSTTEYDKLLVAWDNQNAVDSLVVNFGSSTYTLGSASATARASLISTDLWTITDGGGI